VAVRCQVRTRCEGEGHVRRDGFDLGNNPRFKKSIADTTVGGPYVHREHEFSGRPIVRRTCNGSHDREVGEAGRQAL